MNAITAPNGALIVGPGDRGRELALLTIEKDKAAKERKAEFKQIVLGKWVKPSLAAKPLLENPKPSNSSAKTSSPLPATANQYIGNGSCKLCHEEIYGKWAATKHAQALGTLASKKEDRNHLCLPCHTTGFGQPTGFGKALEGVDLGNVGCEACHGSGEYHVTTGNRNLVVSNEALCKSCHTAEWSPKFVYDEYAKRVH
jgi:predicted CXXCH cytochrome family protein